TTALPRPTAGPERPRGASGAPARRSPRRLPRAPGAGAVGVAVVLGLGAAIVLFADALGIDDRTPFVQVIAFRPQLAAGLVVLAGLVLLLARRAWPTAVALGLVGVVGLGIVLPRAIASGQAGETGGPELTVLTASAYLSRADPEALAALIRARTPDVVVLPEARGSLRSSLQQALVDESGGEEGQSGYRAFAADAPGDDSAMSVFVRRDLGRPTATPNRDTEFPSLVLDLPDVEGRAVRVVATHPQSPKPGDTAAWRRDVGALSRWCTGDRATVVAGDLNATLDHAEFRSATAGCADAASEVGDGLAGTWPSALPSVLGAQIDHVLTAGGPQPRAAEVVDVPGSDHRGLLVRVGLG
ncbi:endonuclease/exonuclease/phosphatase family protein, partial [Actinomycetospora chlora]|uniref:endonuclease/exonuclease/phosphatase family protein n=1 Tax=Actinomycetospora chlora TaxID=663608 RepID=UPI0031E9DC38